VLLIFIVFKELWLFPHKYHPFLRLWYVEKAFIGVLFAEKKKHTDSLTLLQICHSVSSSPCL